MEAFYLKNFVLAALVLSLWSPLSASELEEGLEWPYLAGTFLLLSPG